MREDQLLQRGNKFSAELEERRQKRESSMTD